MTKQIDPNKQYWAVCLHDKVVKVYRNYDVALEESAMYTLETGVSHDVQPAVLKGNKQ